MVGEGSADDEGDLLFAAELMLVSECYDDFSLTILTRLRQLPVFH